MSEPASRRYGLIGAGHSAYAHVRALSEVAAASLVAVAETDGEALNDTMAFLQASRFKPAIYSDWREMLQLGELDAVVIASDGAQHFDMLSEALQTDRAIFVEVPICNTFKEAKQLSRLASKRPGLLQVGLDCRCLPEVMNFVAGVQADASDPPRLVKLSVNGLFHADMALAFRTIYPDGAPLDQLCGPYLDLLRWLTGAEPVRLSVNAGHVHPASRKKRDKKQPPRYDHAVMVLDFANGAKGVLDLALFGTPHIGMSVVTGQARHELTLNPAEPAPGHGPIAFSLRQFDQACATGQPAGASFADGVRALELGLLAQQAAVSGKAVTV